MPSSTTRTAFVTGGNRGIGLAIARGLVEHGLDVILAVRDLDSGREAQRVLATRERRIELVALDLLRPESIAHCLAALHERALHVDVLVNNAGTCPDGDVLQVSDDVMRASMELHFFGPLALAQGLVPAMQRARYGRIVSVSSGWGALSEGLEGPAAYSLSKAALNALTLKLARDAGPHVKANAMCPGWVRTRMGGHGAPRSPDEGADTAVWLATIPENGPTGGFFRDRAPIAW